MIAPSWVISAAHCAFRPDGNPMAVVSWLPGFAGFVQATLSAPTPPPTPPGPVVGPTPPRPPVSAPRDQTAPVISRARLSTSTIKVARSGATMTRKAGAKLSFFLSEASVVTVTVLKLKGKRYKALSPRVPLAQSAGSVSRRFSGRLGGKALRTGRYKLRLGAVDTAGNAARPVTLAFTIVR